MTFQARFWSAPWNIWWEMFHRFKTCLVACFITELICQRASWLFWTTWLQLQGSHRLLFLIFLARYCDIRYTLCIYAKVLTLHPQGTMSSSFHAGTEHHSSVVKTIAQYLIMTRILLFHEFLLRETLFFLYCLLYGALIRAISEKKLLQSKPPFASLGVFPTTRPTHYYFVICSLFVFVSCHAEPRMYMYTLFSLDIIPVQR